MDNPHVRLFTICYHTLLCFFFLVIIQAELDVCVQTKQRLTLMIQNFMCIAVYLFVLAQTLSEPKVQKKVAVTGEKAVKEPLFKEHPAMLQRDPCRSGNRGVSR